MNVLDLSARILAATADRLDEQAFIEEPCWGGPVSLCITAGTLDAALAVGTDFVLRSNRWVNHLALETAREAVRKCLPPFEGTVAEYAARLRAVELPSAA
ncbi:hypothetical protein [Streptomyces sp. NPDC008150]|uniref:hypothetical protein n=1 Tax=Streptomyces sp. NPDC008150 TaxID=3364816 RepID=UPI0036E7768C